MQKGKAKMVHTKPDIDFFCLDLLSSSQIFLQACSPLSEQDLGRNRILSYR